MPRIFDQRPSASDKIIRWNAPQRDGKRVFRSFYGETCEKDPFRYLYSPHIKLMDEGDLIIEGLDSFESVQPAFLNAINEFLNQHGRPVIDEFGRELFGEFSMAMRAPARDGGVMFDRTLEVAVSQIEPFTPDLILFLRRMLAEQYPLWRIHVVGTAVNGEPSVTIYPDCILVGDIVCTETDVASRIEEWQRTVAIIRAVTHREYEYCRRVKRVLADQFRNLDPLECHLLATFEVVFNSDANEIGCWILNRKKPCDIRMRIPEGKNGSSTGAFWIDSMGQFSHSWPQGTDCREVTVYGIPRGMPRVLCLEDLKDGRRWTWQDFEICPVPLAVGFVGGAGPTGSHGL